MRLAERAKEVTTGVWRYECGNEVADTAPGDNQMLQLTGIQLRSMRLSLSLSELIHRSGLNRSASGPKTDVSR